jgi:predicted nucleotidyltransferase
MSGNIASRQPENIVQLMGWAVAWAAGRKDVRAVALVGSYARGGAGADSDIDLMLLVDDPPALAADQGWAAGFAPIDRVQTEDWGEVTSVRVWYLNGLEVEFAIADPDWARLPLDEGSAQVLLHGFASLYDPQGLLSAIAPPNPPAPSA